MTLTGRAVLHLEAGEQACCNGQSDTRAVWLDSGQLVG